MVNLNLLRGQIRANGLTQAQAAEQFGMAAGSLSRKLCEKRDFTLSETLRIRRCLSLTDQQYADIFLSETSQIRNASRDPTDQAS